MKPFLVRSQTLSFSAQPSPIQRLSACAVGPPGRAQTPYPAAPFSRPSRPRGRVGGPRRRLSRRPRERPAGRRAGKPKKTKPRPLARSGFRMGSPAMSYFHWKYNQLSSALKCFTVLFGMGRRGSTTLWSPGNLEFFRKRNEAGCAPS